MQFVSLRSMTATGFTLVVFSIAPTLCVGVQSRSALRCNAGAGR